MLTLFPFSFSSSPEPQLIVYTDDMVEPSQRTSKPSVSAQGVKVMSVQEVCDMGKENSSKISYAKPKADSMAVIMYTVSLKPSIQHDHYLSKQRWVLHRAG